MEAELVRELPGGEGWQYEPKWDGFRGLLENASGDLRLWSRNARPLLRYFPELVPLAKAAPAALRARRRDRDRAQGRARLRRHADAPPPCREPRAKALGGDPRALHRLRRALWKGEQVWKEPLAKRRTKLGRVASAVRTLARDARPRPRRVQWLERFEAIGLDGVVAKRRDSPYLPGSRDGVVKVKPREDSGLRRRGRPLEGEADAPRHVAARAVRQGRAALRRLVRRRARAARHDARAREATAEGRTRRGASRSRTAGEPASSQESALRPELVARSGTTRSRSARIRHGTRFLRFRPDKDPPECTWPQVRPRRKKGDPALDELFGA